MKRKILCVILTAAIMLTVMIFPKGIEISAEEEKSLRSTAGSQAVTVDASVTVDAQLMTYAKAVALMEKSTGKLLYAENENERLYPASVTKIMSILLVCEAIDSGKIKLSDTVECSDNAASKGGSQIWLEPGEQMTVEELLKAACIYSANDACTLLGEYVCGSEQAFVSAMNSRAKELGMENTNFDNCTGLDDTTETHLTTAYDIALMSRELLKHDVIRQYTTTWMDTLRNGETQLVNTNKLVRSYNGITGLKTGTTEKAGCCVSATAERNGMELIAVVLGSENSNDRFTTASNLLDWGFANYEIFTPEAEDISGKTVKVLKGKEQYVDIILPQLSPVLINKGQSGEITVKTELADAVEAPVEENQILGKISVFIGEQLLDEYDIKAENYVPGLNFFDAFLKLLSSFSLQRNR